MSLSSFQLELEPKLELKLQLKLEAGAADGWQLTLKLTRTEPEKSLTEKPGSRTLLETITREHAARPNRPDTQ